MRMGEQKVSGALAGVRIIDFTEGTAGPYLGMLLAEQGADVIKVESPSGDRARGTPTFHALNHSKRGVVLDLAAVDDRRRALDLVSTADVTLVDGLQSEAEKKGISYAQLRQRNAEVIYCALPLYGSKGSYAALPPDDGLVAALAGINSLQFSYGGTPVFLVTRFVPYAAAVLGAGAVSAALFDKARTGRGEYLEASGLSGAFALGAASLVDLNYTEVGRISQVNPDPKGAAPNYRVYKAADGQWLMLGALTPAFLIKTVLTLGIEDILADPSFQGFPHSIPTAEGVQAVGRRMEEAFASKPRAEWLEILEQADIPAGSVQTRDDFLEDPQVDHNGMRVEIEDPGIGRTTQIGVPLTLCGTPGGIRGAAPLLGQHNEEVLTAAAPVEPRTAPSTAEDDHVPGPLAGIMVLDLGTTYAGPFNGMLLADLGANVIKVEPLDGDPFRFLGVAFIGVNRGKRAIAFDLKKEEGLRLFYDLVRKADVVIDNFRAGVVQRLKIDYDTLSKINQRIICCSITPYGSSGPMAGKGGYDPVIGAISGLQRAQGGYSPDDEPVYHNVAAVDFTSGLMATFGVCAALCSRTVTGHGQRVETCLINNAMAAQIVEFMRYDGKPPDVQGGRDILGITPVYRLFACADGWIMLAARTLQQGQEIKRIVGPGLPVTAERLVRAPWNSDEAGMLEDFFRSQRRASALRVLTEAGIPCCPCPLLEELFTDEHLSANDMWWEAEHPELGKFRQIGQLVKWGRRSIRLERPAPIFAQHSREVLLEFGIEPSRAEDLIKTGVVVQAAQSS